MKKLIILLFVFISFTAFGQHEMLLRVSEQQYANETPVGGVPVVESFSQDEIAINTTTGTATAPSGIVNGDLLVMFCVFDESVDADPTSTGWTFLTGTKDTNNGKQSYVLWKAASSESGNYTVNWTGAEMAIFTILRISGANTTSPFDVVGAFTNDSSINSTPPDITSTVDNTLALSYVAIDRGYRTDGTETATGTGWTAITTMADVNDGDGCAFMAAQKDVPTAGSVGTLTFGDWTGDGHASQIINIKSN